MSAIAAIKTAHADSTANVAYRPTGRIVTGDAAVSYSRTFNPEGFSLPGVTRWVDRTGGIAIGYPAFTLSVRPPTKASRVYRVTAKVILPTMEQTSASTASGIQPVPTKAYDCTAIMEFLLPERSTKVERQALFDTVLSLLALDIAASDGSPLTNTDSPLRAAVDDFEPPY